MTEPIKTVEEFIEWTKGMQGELLLYRGLTDADWEVEYSAYRRVGSMKVGPLVMFAGKYGNDSFRAG